MKCSHCYHDLRDTQVLAGAAKIIARRRRAAGNQMTSDEARERQIKSNEARRANTERANDEQ